jgi:putative AlgH/UPF0301 family transcriptional regulator
MVRVTQYLVYCVVLCRSFFVLFVFCHFVVCLFVGGPMSYLRYFCLFVGGPMSYLRYFCLFVGGPMSYLRYFCLFVNKQK